jgi:hypothetical protein
MAGISLELKYFNSFILKNSAKNDIEFFQFEPFPGKADAYGLPTFTNDFIGTPTAPYNAEGYPIIDFSARNPIFWSIPQYDASWANIHKMPIWDFDTSFFNVPVVQGLRFQSWEIEEARIKGGYNNTPTDYGARAYVQNDEQNKSTHRFSSLIYSGVYNSRTGINETNVFSVGEDITKTAEPAYGSIQRLYAEDTNMTIMQENKLSRALIDKDAIYSAEGSPVQTTSNIVIGQIQPYAGRFGISTNPESFDFFGYRKYMADKNRNAILRLSNDGVTEISQYGMSDFFRDELRGLRPDPYEVRYVVELSPWTFGFVGNYTGQDILIFDKISPGMMVKDTVTSEIAYITEIEIIGNTIYLKVNGAISNTNARYEIYGYRKDEAIGGYDQNNDFYTVSLQPKERVKYPPTDTYTLYSVDVTEPPQYTLTFDESVRGWTSFFSYYPDQMFSLKGNFYTTKGDSIYKHYSEFGSRANFYGTQGDMSITFIFNEQASITKNFKTISYEGSNGWEISEMFSDIEGEDNGNLYADQIMPIQSYDGGTYIDYEGLPQRAGFLRKENRYVANIKSNNIIRPGQVIIEENSISANNQNVAGVKGYFTSVKVQADINALPTTVPAMELFAVGTEFAVSSY